MVLFIIDCCVTIYTSYNLSNLTPNGSNHSCGVRIHSKTFVIRRLVRPKHRVGVRIHSETFQYETRQYQFNSECQNGLLRPVQYRFELVKTWNEMFLHKNYSSVQFTVAFYCRNWGWGIGLNTFLKYFLAKYINFVLNTFNCYNDECERFQIAGHELNRTTQFHLRKRW